MIRPVAKIVIIGSGFAGVATARSLARDGGSDILVLERDPAPGQRASGRNAGMIRTLLVDPDEQDLALRSASEIASIGGGAAFARTGSLILGAGDDVARLDAAAERSGAAGSPHAPDRVGDWLGDATFDRGWLSEDDGVADVSALHSLFLSEARRGGVRLETGVEVEKIRVEDGRATGVETSRGFKAADVVVNAAGAWAGEIGAAGCARAVRIEPRRRHLMSTGPIAGTRPDLPFIWHDTAGYYFRPESGGFLLSACDETPMPPCDPMVDPEATTWLAEKLTERAPRLADLPLRKVWACLRTFADDDRFVIGWDPVLPGLYWVAALNGKGVTVSAAVGDLAASEIAEGPDARNPFSPHRFLTESEER
jgi:D-arginine dehydrogenase